MNCWTCGASVEPSDRFCRGCGMGQGTNMSWYYEPVWIAVLTLFALGPFSLPLVWRSPKLSKEGRLAFTGFIAFFTLYLLFSVKRSVDLLRSMLG